MNHKFTYNIIIYFFLYVLGEIDIFWRFYDDTSLDHWIVTSDSDHAEGFSKCDLHISQQGYGLFSGNLCSRVPKDGRIQNSGYCNMLTKRVMVLNIFIKIDILVAIESCY